MNGFSLGTIWEETVAFLRRERALMVPVALGLLGPAQVMLGLGMPRAMPEEAAEQAARGEMLLVLPAMLLVLLANIAISRLALVPGSSVGEALSEGIRRLPRSLAAMLLMGAALVAVAIAIVAAATVGIMLFGGDPRSPAITGQLLALIMIPAFVLLVRMMLLVPVLAMEEGGVLDAIRRTWALGRGRALRFVALLLIVMLLSALVQLVEMFVIGSIIQLLGLATGGGELWKAIHIVINAGLDALMSLGFAVFLAFAYRATVAEAS